MTNTLILAMTHAEARQCVDEINGRIGDVRHLLLDLYEREGWRALGYATWRECAQVEFLFSQSRVYQLLDAAYIERNISTTVEKPLAEWVLRPLAKVEPDAQREIWQRAVESAPNGKVTAAHVEHIVRQFQIHVAVGESSPEPINDEDDLITTERVGITAWELRGGGTVTPESVSRLTGISTNGAWRMLSKLSRVLPIIEEHGQWFRCPDSIAG